MKRPKYDSRCDAVFGNDALASAFRRTIERPMVAKVVAFEGQLALARAAMEQAENYCRSFGHAIRPQDIRFAVSDLIAPAHKHRLEEQERRKREREDKSRPPARRRATRVASAREFLALASLATNELASWVEVDSLGWEDTGLQGEDFANVRAEMERALARLKSAMGAVQIEGAVEIVALPSH